MLKNELDILLDDIESLLTGIRRELLVYQQESGSIPRFSIYESKLTALERSAAGLTDRGMETDIAELLAQLRMYSAPDARISLDAVRAMLDKISDIESKIALSRLSDEGFADDLDRLLDETWGLLPPEKVDVAETFDFSPADEFDIDQELLDVFADEAETLLSGIEEHLQRLVTDPNDQESLWEIRRAAHTFKGSAGIVGLQKASRLAHRIEDHLDRLAEDGVTGSERLIPLLITATECLRTLTGGHESERLDHVLRHVHSELDLLGSEIAELPAVKEEAKEPTQPKQTENNGSVENHNQHQTIVRIPIDQLDTLVALVRELVVNRSMIAQRLSEFDVQVDELHNSARRLKAVNSRLEVDLGSAFFEHDGGIGGDFRFAGSAGRKFDSTTNIFDALEMDRYTELHEAVRDLAETASDITSIDHAIETVKENIQNLSQTQRALFDEAQGRLMAMRMLPFDTLKTRLERAVRVTCEDENKDVELAIENGDLLVDTQMLDALTEPLLHLMKNAVVHGIEPRETRRLLGKSEKGKVKIRVENEETHVILTISDDGGGIAVNQLRERAVASEMITASAASAMSNDDLIQLMFAPGLTTARKLNLNAGRGVGMNIVRQSIESHSGTLNVTSALHRGTSFVIRLPLKLAVTTALLVRCEGGIYAVPLKHIERIVETGKDEVGVEEGVAIVEHGGRRYELQSLTARLGLPQLEEAGSSYITALLLSAGDRDIAISVNTVIRTEEIVIKPLPKPFDEIRDVLGAAFLSTGELAPILDLRYMTDRRAGTVSGNSAPRAAVRRTKILVVDDSPSVRHMTTRVMRDAGWEVVAAKDGIDALEMLAVMPQLPDVILTDIEMPRMGGFELAGAIGDDETLSGIPVVVITSRTAEKHREKAREKGVAAYLVKPYVESELIDLVSRLTTESVQ